jgi:hypothetical protein
MLDNICLLHTDKTRTQWVQALLPFSQRRSSHCGRNDKSLQLQNLNKSERKDNGKQLLLVTMCTPFKQQQVKKRFEKV